MHTYLIKIIGLITLLITSNAYAVTGDNLNYIYSQYHPSSSLYKGFVHARAIIRDDSGLPLWASYNEQGGHTLENGIDLIEASKGRVLGGQNVRQYFERLNAFRARYGQEIEMYEKKTYEQMRNSQSFTAYDGSIIEDLPSFPAEYHTISLPVKSKRYTTDGRQLEILALPFNYKRYPKPPEPNIRSVLFNNKGEMMKESEGRLGYLTAFKTDKEGKVPDVEEYETDTETFKNYFTSEDKLAAPLSGVKVSGYSWIVERQTQTDFEGKYGILFKYGCPNAFFPTYTFIDAELSYTTFHAKGVPNKPYWISHRLHDSCYGLVDLYGTGANPGSLQHITDLNFRVAVNVLSGVVRLKGVEINDGPTTYYADQSPAEEFVLKKDYNGDGISDFTERGDYSVDGVFVPSLDGKLYGVYIGGKNTFNQSPSFTKVVDQKPHLIDQGLVKTINRKDMENTDFYLFRESTGELITERKGLPDRRVQLADGSEWESLTADDEFTYTVAIRSFEDVHSTSGGNYESWQAWQAREKMNPALHERKSDFIRTGESIQVIAINRATGYMGSARVSMSESISGAPSKPGSASDLTIRVPTIELAPPNLRVWAERESNLHGLMKGHKELNQISNEGAATVDDLHISIYSEWLDEYGNPLPHQLTGHGYTARLVSVANNDASNPYSSAAKEFAINPGLNRQTLTIPEVEISKRHYYLQVNGEKEPDQADFQTGAHQGVLRHRPNKYVPIKVPVYDEQRTEDIESYSNKNTEFRGGGDVFSWIYRPEFSYSIVDLNINSILRTKKDGEVVDLLQEEEPLIMEDDSLVQILFDLSQSNFDRITPLDGEQAFIFSLGEQEVSVEVDSGLGYQNSKNFASLDHLLLLESEDFFSIKLYLNGDAQNVLWDLALNRQGILLTTSSNSGSNSNKSFIRCTAAQQGNQICDAQPAIRAELLAEADEGTEVIWKVEALEGPSREDDTSSSNATKKKTMYGQTQSMQVSEFGGSQSGDWEDISGAGNGKYGSAFISEKRLFEKTKHFRFKPNMSDLDHMVSVYNSPICTSQYIYCDTGTNMTDVWRHNPHVAFKVSAELDGKVYEAVAKMDHIDVLRQEYINHIFSTLNHSGGDARLGIKKVTVPTRDQFIPIPENGLWVENNLTGDRAWNYEYDVMLDVSMRSMLGEVLAILAANITTKYQTPNGIEIQWPAGATLVLTSGYRNPERNERVRGASGSRHMLGRALDLAVHGITTDAEKEIAYFILWKMLKENRPPSADLVQLEDDPADWIIKYKYGTQSESTDSDWGLQNNIEVNNGIPDGFLSTKHVHIQDNP